MKRNMSSFFPIPQACVHPFHSARGSTSSHSLMFPAPCLLPPWLLEPHLGVLHAVQIGRQKSCGSLPAAPSQGSGTVHCSYGAMARTALTAPLFLSVGNSGCFIHFPEAFSSAQSLNTALPTEQLARIKKSQSIVELSSIIKQARQCKKEMHFK